MKHIFTSLFLIFLTGVVNTQSLYFPPLLGDTWETTTPEELGWCESEIPAFYDWLEDTNSRSFIVLKDGKIVMENYFNGHGPDSLWYWASAGKTITAMLIGIAQENGYLSIEDPTSDYLGTGWTSAPPEKEALITVEDQLKMTAGLNDLAFNCVDPSCLLYLEDPGNRWSYHNGPYRLLLEVIKQAVADDFDTVNAFHFNKLQLKTGMGGLWIRTGVNDLYFSTARAMARFGLLVLNDGVWNGNPVLSDITYFNQMITPSQDINKSYGYLWWLNGYESHMLPITQIVYEGPFAPNAPSEIFSAVGKNGQILSIYPSENIIILRMGDNPDETFVPVAYHNELWNRFQDVACLTTPVEEIQSATDYKVYPNPFLNEVHIENHPNFEQVHLTDVLGRTIITTKDRNLQLGHLDAGLYLIGIEDKSGKTVWRRLLKRKGA